MRIIGIDPGLGGAIAILEDKKVLDLFEMPVMAEGKKNKKQVNSSQIFNEISERIKKIDKKNIKNLFSLILIYKK